MATPRIPDDVMARRFWPKVIVTESCWLWDAAKNRDGYALWDKSVAHRFAYVSLRGSIPEGLELDHLCRNRSCVNPDHLEPVTRAENVRRAAAAQTHCRRAGHLYDEENTRFSVKGTRLCRACDREAGRIRRERRRAA